MPRPPPSNCRGPVWVVKSQIHAGGRGKGKFKEASAGDKGGVRIAKSVAEVAEFAKQMLGATLVTVQTGPHGKQVNRLYIEDGSDIDKEFYLSLLVDRETSGVSFVVSTEGGVNIEDVAHNTPEKIVTFSVDPATGIMGHHGRTVAKALELTGDLAKQAEKLIDAALHRLRRQGHGDAGDQSAGRHQAGPAARARRQGVVRRQRAVPSSRGGRRCATRPRKTPRKSRPSKYDLNYVTLDGTIGCMVNGAGLAMATMDIIKLYGMAPANFLDVGGGATKEKVAAAFKIITADPNVKGILVNIFGGIMKCDVIAEGVVAAVKEVGLKVPLVVRLEGTNVELGKKIIRESGLNVLPADNLDDAAQKIVKAVKGG